MARHATTLYLGPQHEWYEEPEQEEEEYVYAYAWAHAWVYGHAYMYTTRNTALHPRSRIPDVLLQQTTQQQARQEPGALKLNDQVGRDQVPTTTSVR